MTIFVDTNIYMYAAGAPHRHKESAAKLVASIAAGEVSAVTSVEVLQEILHRYRAIGRWSDGSRVYDLVRDVMTSIVDVTLADLDEARRILDGFEELSARDALHAATAIRTGCDSICSHDSGFDVLTTVGRITPGGVLTGDRQSDSEE